MKTIDQIYEPVTVEDEDDLGSNRSTNQPLLELTRTRMSRRTALKGAAGIAAGVAAGGALTHAVAQGTPAATPAGEQVDPTKDQPQQTFPLAAEKTTLRAPLGNGFRSSTQIESFPSSSCGRPTC